MNNTIEYLLNKKSNNFNLIRLLAAISVIYGHTSAITGHGPADLFLQYVGFKFIGGVAVDIFFVISGFFITSSFVNAKNYKYFLVSRILRIYPALIVCILLTVFIVGPLLTESTEYFTNKQTWEYLYLNSSAYSTVYHLPGVFTNLFDKGVNGSLWSIAVEVKLYIIVFIFGLFSILKNKYFFNSLFFVIIVISYFKPTFFEYILQFENHRHVALMFLIGSFIYINKEMLILNPFILLFLCFFAATQHGTDNFVYAYMVLLPYMVFYIGFSKEIKVFNKIGDYSYGVYLYGWVVQQIVIYFSPALSNLNHAIISIIFSLFMAMISWHLIESRLLKLKERFI